MTLTATDVFCGAGGESIGLAEAGFDIALAANHWIRAIETHSSNFPNTDHLCADVSNYDMRRLPSTDLGWFSPECTWHSPAGGRKRLRAQLDLLDDYVPTDGGLRSRATMLDVIRATEVHRYPVVIVENVIEVTVWPLFSWWLDGMRQLGYEAQIVCVSSAHIGDELNLPAPQWRDRLFIVFNRDDVRRPDVDPRPLAWCPSCDVLVEARQAWKRADRARIGKYGQQYLYRCPEPACMAIVEPFVRPAAVAIDWNDLGRRIGDREKPLAPATMRRIQAGLEMFAQPTVVTAAGNTFESGSYKRAWPAFESPLMARTATATDAIVLNVNHHGDDGRPYPADGAPLGPRTSRIGDGLALTEPFVTMLRGHNRPMAVEEPLATLSTGRNHGLTVPPGAFLSKHHGGLDYERIEHMNKAVDDPMGSIVTKPNVSLVIPYRRGRAKTTGEPLHTLATRESAALVRPEVDVEDCHFRMLKPRESLRGQRFPDTYEVKGNQSEQQMQAGNAVSSNVACWLGRAAAEVLS